MLSAGLGRAGPRLRPWFLRVAGTPWRAAAAGAILAAALHSSSATTILLVGLVGSGALPLTLGVAAAMGANVGTTVTAQWLALTAGGGAWPLWGLAALAWAGWTARARWGPGGRRRAGAGAAAGQALLGAGAILAGLDTLGRSLAPLAGAPWFGEATRRFAAEPWLGVLAGAVLTACVLSSTVTIGLLQALATQGLISLPAALPVLYGDNIGTTSDTLLASMAAGREGRALALAHLLFNLLGAVLFLLLHPLVVSLVEAMAADPARQIAHAHTLLNLTTAMVLLPFAEGLASLARRLAGARPLRRP